jgi:hypothetical protein
VSYTNGGHGMPTTTVDEVRDYHKRIISWYDAHLKGISRKRARSKRPIRRHGEGKRCRGLLESMRRNSNGQLLEVCRESREAAKDL